MPMEVLTSSAIPSYDWKIQIRHLKAFECRSAVPAHTDRTTMAWSTIAPADFVVSLCSQHVLSMADQQRGDLSATLVSPNDLN